MFDTVVILQPPLVQLNCPYPSGAYLSAFFRHLGREGIPAPEGSDPVPPFPLSVRWVDAGNLFFRHLFSRPGLERLFALCSGPALVLADRAEAEGDVEKAYQLRRYVSQRNRWIGWMDGIVSILCGGDRELSHAFVRSPTAPRGARMDRFLSEAEPTVDSARLLATLALEDIADFITVAFDGEFSLVRYAESLAASERSFAKVEQGLSRPLVAEFMRPFFDSLCVGTGLAGEGQTLFCISVPFPGCLVGALSLAQALRARFGPRAVISMGGGYVNTELRNYAGEDLFRYVDHLSLDRGYGGYAALFRELLASPRNSPEAAASPRIIRCPPNFAAFEDQMTEALVPDYRDIDFSKYPRLSDSGNPMHRLWSDGAWLKAYLAHGCYWHRCSFCDVSLDYIRAYRPVDIPALYAGLRRQARDKGLSGIHLVDEAAPPRALREFARENLIAAAIGGTASDDTAGLLSFWGNIRFERTFSRDLADFLSAGGLVGVSGGIEIASPEGFKAVDKGIDLENLVAVCAAFKEAGVLVHSYLIYGYWNETAQDVSDSAEVMRQLFAAGLVDSAFWHKFVLTRHSRVYREWRESCPSRSAAIRPVDIPGDFADNDLDFEGSADSRRYTGPLDGALSAWMAGDGLDVPIREWFPFRMPEPSVAPDLIELYIASYEARRDGERDEPFDATCEYWWTASLPVIAGGKGASRNLVWWNLGEEVCLSLEADLALSIIAAVCGRGAGDHAGSVSAKSGPATAGLATAGPADPAILASLPTEAFRALRHNGLCRVNPPSAPRT